MIDVQDLEHELGSLPEGWVGLLETKAENSLQVSLATIKILTDKDYTGIVLSASRPYSNLMKIYGQNNINTGKIFVLDCVSKDQTQQLEEHDNVLYIENIYDLTGISISISTTLDTVEGNKFIFIDSITTMLIYNKPDVFAQFIHSVLVKMRMKGITGLLISLEAETDKEIRAEIAQLCDRVIKL